MMNVILVLAACLAQDPQFPLFEKDPWNGFPVGSSVTREITVNRILIEETTTLKEADKDGKTLHIRRNGEEAEGPVKFTSFSGMLLTEGSGYKLTGRSNRAVSVGGVKVKGLVREISSGGEGGIPWRITTADEVPGGIVEITYEAESEESKTTISYGWKGQEKIKIQAQEVTCSRFELKVVEAGKAKKTVEGSFWLSTQVPGLLVRSRVKQTQAKESVETYVNVARFDVKR